MSVTNTRQRFGDLPVGFLGALALVMLVERTVARYDLDLSEVTTMNWSFSRHAARAEAPRAEILCLGTSLMKFGVLPRSLENATGRTAYNLAVCNGHMPTSYFLLRRALESGSKPVAILVDCQDGPVDVSLRDKQPEGLRVNLRNWPELLSDRECLELAWTARDASFYASMLVARVFPSAKSRHEVRNLIMAALDGRDGSPRETVLAYLRNWNANLGANVMPAAAVLAANNDPPPATADRVVDHFAEGRWLRNRLTDVYTKRLLELAKAHEIPVFWIVPPVPPNALAIRKGVGLDLYFDRMAKRAQRINPDVTVIDGTRSHYPPDAFCDKAHMNATGTAVFSEEVATVVAASLADRRLRGKRVTLPEFTNGAERRYAAFEDVNMSRIVVKEGRLGLRR